jgi:Tfp pilus assembly protein PilX
MRNSRITTSVVVTSRSHNERGISTLFVAMSLLGILTVVTLFAATYGVYEQRVSGNEYRYKLAFQAAEAGLNQGAEFIKLNRNVLTSMTGSGWRVPGAERWQRCTETKPTTMLADPCLAEPDAARRANMYRYVGTDNTGVLPLASVLPNSTQTFTTVGGAASFAATYEVYASLCMLDGLTPPSCVQVPPTTENRYYVSIASRGQLSGESATAVVKSTFGNYNSFPGEPAAPLVAASALGLGNAQIVPNPNGGGTGVPLSVWSAGDSVVSSGGSFSSCHFGEWLANYGNPAPSSTDVLNGVCASCSCNGLCPGFGLLSGAATGCSGTTRTEAEDILDVDNHAGTNRDSKYFPDDLFEYTFGVRSADAEAYLTQNAQQITACSSLTAASSGMYWYTPTSDCSLGNVGSIDNPVILVSNGKITLNSNSTIFGLLYVRSTVTGDVFKATGTPQVYGAVLLEGNATVAGSPQIIFNSKVFSNLSNNTAILAPVSNSWSDDVSL